MYLRKVLLKLSKKDIILKEKKVKNQIRKLVSQKKHPRKSLLKTWVYTNHLIFPKELSRLQKSHFPLKGYMDGYFWLCLEKHLLQAFFPVSIFLRLRRKYSGKKPAETQSVKIQVKSGEIPVGKNLGKIMQNVDSHRLTPKSAKLTCYPILKIQS